MWEIDTLWKEWEKESLRDEGCGGRQESHRGR